MSIPVRGRAGAVARQVADWVYHDEPRNPHDGGSAARTRTASSEDEFSGGFRNPFFFKHLNPEAVKAGLLNQDDRIVMPGLRLFSRSFGNSANNPASSPADTECFDTFSRVSGDNEVISQAERLSSNETNRTKIGAGGGRLGGSSGWMDDQLRDECLRAQCERGSSGTSCTLMLSSTEGAMFEVRCPLVCAVSN
ncbi:hypothetical protein ABIA41_003347 [Bradyrhizobium sp. USDA 313]|nr:hypothetical protein EHH60_36345 [Bradyrhizobium sp. RP6]